MNGRPFSVLSQEQVDDLCAEYKSGPFNISERARQLGVKASTLSYHIRGGKAAHEMASSTWIAASRCAHTAYRRGDLKAAAAWMRKAAGRIDKLIEQSK